jgi:hypothetical protein
MMIGPEPIRRIEVMSSRLGIAGEYGGDAVSQVKRSRVRHAKPLAETAPNLRSTRWPSVV